MQKRYHSLYNHRFEIFLTIQVMVLFGSLLIPMQMFETYVMPILYSANLLTGLLIISKEKRILGFCFLLFIISLIVFGESLFSRDQVADDLFLIRLSVYFIINTIVTKEITKQVWLEQEVDKKVILGLISGFISIGFLGFFLFTSINIIHDGAAFAGDSVNAEHFHSDTLLYYSFITMLTIGYGDIAPVIPVAQKAAVLVGLVGQFYLVIVTAVVLEKYIRHISKQ